MSKDGDERGRDGPRRRRRREGIAASPGVAMPKKLAATLKAAAKGSKAVKKLTDSMGA